MVDAIVVHKWVKAKFVAKHNDLELHLYEDSFILNEKSGKPIKCSKELDDILIVLEKYSQLGYYTS